MTFIVDVQDGGAKSVGISFEITHKYFCPDSRALSGPEQAPPIVGLIFFGAPEKRVKRDFEIKEK